MWMLRLSTRWITKTVFCCRRLSTRPGLLKFIDLIAKRDGSVGQSYFTRLVKHAKTSKEITDLIEDAEQRFGSVHSFLLSSAAHTASTRQVLDCKLSIELLRRIPKQDLSRIPPGVFARVLGCASVQGSLEDAQTAFNMLPPPHRTPTDLARLINSGLDITKAKSMIQELIRFTAPSNMDIRAVGVFLKVCFLCNDLELGQLLWSWSEDARKITGKENLIPLTIQFLLLCGKAGRLELCQSLWKESISFGVTSEPAVIGAMFSVLAFFGGNETEEFLSTIPPKRITESMLVSILTAYSHQGCPLKAWHFLQEMKRTNNQIVSLPAFACVVDGFARRGEFESAMLIVEHARKDGISPNVIIWKSILSPCRHYAELSTALRAFKEIKTLCTSILDQQHLASAYVLMADVYKACGDFNAAERLHEERLRRGLKKERGRVTVNVHGKTHFFYVGEIPEHLSSYTEAIEAKLLEWKIFIASQSVSIESIECRHSEKLALAFACIMGLRDITLEKNLRICSACHAASILIAQYEEITIRHWDNSKRVHIIKDGTCTCGGSY